MPNYGVPNSTSITTTYKSLVWLANSSAAVITVGAGLYKRGRVYDILVGTNGTPADNFMEYDCTRATVGTTPAAVTVGISSLSSNFTLDLADNNNALNFIGINSSVEGGIAATTELWYVGVNQRASYRWVASPGSELVWPAVSSATANNGIALRARGTYTGTATGNVLFSE